VNERFKKIISCFDQAKINGLLVTNDSNIRYLTNFPASDSYLLITKKEIFYITDARYTLEVKKSLKNIAVKEHTGSLIAEACALAKKNKVTRLGYDPQHLTVAQFNRLMAKKPKSISLFESTNLVEQFRQIKTKKEVNHIREALKIHHKALKYLKRIIKPGVTEWQIFTKLESFVRAEGQSFSFDPIVASGINSCYPHASVTRRNIGKNDPVLIDFGIDVKGYKSDLTRMFFLGKIPNIVREVNDFVKESQQEAIKIIKPGVCIAEIDLAARDYLHTKKLAKYFGHSLGHGVGLDIHEAPGVSHKNTSLLKEGMVITIEPGVYIPNKFGIRIEDMVLVTKKGFEVLSDNSN
jgi:Xaa-Pro aminopeptidase